ncbi:MAG: phosphoenolpyruvate synthase [Phycisphaerales bacterium]|nr:phosphoenolpyruvate synthase [Phycisphaerales bacterium]
MTIQTSRFIVPLEQLTLQDLPRVGGKNASLGEMIRGLHASGVQVPGGFAITTDAYRKHLAQNNLTDEIQAHIDRLDVNDTKELARVGRDIRYWIQDAPLPTDVRDEVMKAYKAMSQADGEYGIHVAVRSSATAEDLPSASFAGQQDTYLFIQGEVNLDVAVRACMASLYTDRAIVYRQQHDIPNQDVALSVGVQRMVRSDLASAGVMFTLDTESGFRDVVEISGSWGLGELLVQGRVNPDEFWVHKPTAKNGHRSVIRKELGNKKVKLVHDEGGTKPTRQLHVSKADQRRFTLTDDEALQLAQWAMAIEDHYSAVAKKPTPMDIEWAKDGITGELFIVQARPETVHSQERELIEVYRVKEHRPAILTGKSVGNSIASGPVRVIHNSTHMDKFQDGEVLVAAMTDPDWNPILKRAVAVVTDRGGRTCHAAIVARELGIPCVVGTKDATGKLHSGQEVTVSCAEGEVGKVYDGTIDFEREEIDPTTLPESPVPLMLNIASPDMAFHHALLPSAGVGLMRIEFLITDSVGIHPMALVHPERVEDRHQRKEIRERTAAYESPSEFFIDRLSSGVAQIAAAFYPRPVIVRFSDFKTNEYAGLLGGQAFEPTEANPMLGFRGASRYYDDRYREGFALECAAISRVRKTMGLTNVKVMIPFCRTIQEGKDVLAEMERNGLERGKDGLQVYVMCEIPNNVIQAEEFSELFDGFSIGSNDLTQLTLGIDRDSAMLSHLFDERDPGVKRMISMVVETAHRCGRPVGICGQAPSDHPDFAEFLVEIGIDSISLNPDSLLEVTRRLGKKSAAYESKPSVSEGHLLGG